MAFKPLFVRYACTLLFVFGGTVIAQQTPTLVVSLVVDQMRAEYLYRFEDQFTGGLQRLLKEGTVFRECHYSYVPTYTGPGHASIYTGTDPMHHGIIGNDWFDRTRDRMVYCVEDPDVTPIGSSNPASKRSPLLLQSTTWTDELEWATQKASKVFAFSLKDRGAILPAGHFADAAFWYDDQIEGFVTSSHYASELPSWLAAFNAEKPVARLMQGLQEPLGHGRFSGPDASLFEKRLMGMGPRVYPLDLAAVYAAGKGDAIRRVPQGNSLLFQVAKRAIEKEQLGRHAQTDVLALSFSTPDYIGHDVGTRAKEIEDVYLRFDLELGAFLAYLDAAVGKDNYLVTLTADHGAADNPGQMRAMGMADAQAWNDADFEASLKEALAPSFAIYPVRTVCNDQVYVLSEFQKPEVLEKIKTALLSHPAVAHVFTSATLSNSSQEEVSLRYNGANKFSGDVFFALKPGHLLYSQTGTTHGSGYSYDTHVPLLFYGKNVTSSQVYRTVKVKDIAPTMSHLLHIARPSASTGEPLKEVLKGKEKTSSKKKRR